MNNNNKTHTKISMYFKTVLLCPYNQCSQSIYNDYAFCNVFIIFHYIFIPLEKQILIIITVYIFQITLCVSVIYSSSYFQIGVRSDNFLEPWSLIILMGITSKLIG